MVVTREMLIRKLAEKSGYYQKDIRILLQHLDEVVSECFSEVTAAEDVMIQLVQGIKVGCSIVPERSRKNPKTQEDIVCKPTCKPKARFSEDFRLVIQNQYEDKKG